MSLSSRNDVKMTTARVSGPSKEHGQAKKTLTHAAVIRGIRPRREAPSVRGTHGNPDLLERAPVVGGALVLEEPAPVRRLERKVHLEAAPVRAARVRPAPLIVMDAEPRVEPRRMVCPPPDRVLSPAPCVREVSEPWERARRGACGEHAHDAGGRAAADHRQPTPGAGPEASNVAVPVGDCSQPRTPAGHAGRRRGDGRGRRRCRARRALTLFAAGGSRGGCGRSGQACEREQQPAGQDGAPQCVTSPGRLQVGGRAGGKNALKRAPLGAAYADRCP